MSLAENNEAYRRCYDAFMALDASRIVHCNIPPEVVVHETSALVRVASEDRDALLLTGIDPEYVDSLAERAAAFKFAVEENSITLNGRPAFDRHWKEAVAKGFELRRYLLKHMRFAYRHMPQLQLALGGIREGRRHHDMVIDLLALWMLYQANPDPLNALTLFDKTAAAEAKVLHETLNRLMAESRIQPSDGAQTKNIMHRAWTWYKIAADEVKSHGQFLFEGTDRYQAYISPWRKQQGKKGGKVSPTAAKAATEASQTRPSNEKISSLP
ncbi:MAG: hypothetical protein JXR76_12805 [Deltaproteobacteria bacterium]|nr:hypothetical protein [Deltaproteobacteria bacterium]